MGSLLMALTTIGLISPFDITKHFSLIMVFLSRIVSVHSMLASLGVNIPCEYRSFNLQSCIINFQSLINKISKFSYFNVLDAPDIVHGCGTWLNSFALKLSSISQIIPSIAMTVEHVYLSTPVTFDFIPN